MALLTRAVSQRANEKFDTEKQSLASQVHVLQEQLRRMHEMGDHHHRTTHKEQQSLQFKLDSLAKEFQAMRDAATRTENELLSLKHEYVIVLDKNSSLSKAHATAQATLEEQTQQMERLSVDLNAAIELANSRQRALDEQATKVTLLESAVRELSKSSEAASQGALRAASDALAYQMQTDKLTHANQDMQAEIVCGHQTALE